MKQQIIRAGLETLYFTGASGELRSEQGNGRCTPCSPFALKDFLPSPFAIRYSPYCHSHP